MYVVCARYIAAFVQTRRTQYLCWLLVLIAYVSNSENVTPPSVVFVDITEHEGKKKNRIANSGLLRSLLGAVFCSSCMPACLFTSARLPRRGRLPNGFSLQDRRPNWWCTGRMTFSRCYQSLKKRGSTILLDDPRSSE